MEYKTFRQRLYESVREVIRRPNMNMVSSNNDGIESSDSSLKYGSMQ